VPRWIAENWIVQIGEGDAEKLAISMSEAPPVTIRVNTLKCTRDELLLILSGEQITATPCKFSQVGIQILSHTPLTLLESFRSGYFSIQDEASQIAGILTGAETGDRVLDICAAPGGKTTCIAEMMGNTGEITAWDVNPRRLKQVQLLASRLGIQIINPAIMDAGKIFAPAVSKPYGKVLLDAPCSGLGVLRRNPEGKWWKTIEEIDALAEIQQRLLANAAEYVSPDGVLVYATCSTTARENEIVVDDFLSKNNEFVLENLQELYPQFAALCTDNGYFRSWPHLHGMDGFFAARLRRRK
jgi:16S rRNA (cytosine967-C5)-methyltransferase